MSIKAMFLFVAICSFALTGCQMTGNKASKCCGDGGKCCKKVEKKECCGEDGKCCKGAKGHHHHDGDHTHS